MKLHKPFKLHKPAQMLQFLELVIPWLGLNSQQLVVKEAPRYNPAKVYPILLNDHNIWTLKHFCLIDARARATFDFYSKLSPKKLKKVLTK